MTSDTMPAKVTETVKKNENVSIGCGKPNRLGAIEIALSVKTPTQCSKQTNVIEKAPLVGPLFVCGPAYSGKSKLIATSLFDITPSAFIGTASIQDDGFKKHVETLQNERNPEWKLCEEPLNISPLIESLAPHHDLLIIDSINQWLGNVFSKSAPNYDHEQFLSHLQMESNSLIASLTQAAQVCYVVIISSELGAGPSPKTADERLFRQCLGLLNQKLACLSQSALIVNFGISQVIKQPG